MATPMTSDQVLAALEAEGVAVQEYRDWRTNNRNSKGAWGPVHGVVIHHTVSSADDASVTLCYYGHSTLPGPLCHGVGRNDGRIALVGHGRANHAGLGDLDVLNAVINEAEVLPADNEATVDGNSRFYGLEIVNLGNGVDTYPWGQYVAAVKWATAHLRAHGWGERSVIGHKEWQPGKIDPAGPVIGPDGVRFDFSMGRFRADVKAALALPAGQWQGDVQQEESVALTTEDIKAIWDHGISNRFRPDANGDPRVIPARFYMEWADSHFDDLVAQISAIKTKLDSLGAPAGAVDLDALADKVADKLAARLAD